MVKRIVQKNSHSGTNTIEPAPYFVYEVLLYKLFKDRAEMISNKLYQSQKPLSLKKDSKFVRTKECILMKTIDLLYAPQEYIDNLINN